VFGPLPLAPGQADLAVSQSRDEVVRSRSLLINPVRSMVKSCGSGRPSRSAHCFARQVAIEIPEGLRPAPDPVLETIAGLTGQIRGYDRTIEGLCSERCPETMQPRGISGVVSLNAPAFVVTLGDSGCFRKSREVGPALGLVPRADQLGDRDPRLRITKTGDALLRRLLVGSARYVLGSFGADCNIRR
jgi:transposase